MDSIPDGFCGNKEWKLFLDSQRSLVPFSLNTILGTNTSNNTPLFMYKIFNECVMVQQQILTVLIQEGRRYLSSETLITFYKDYKTFIQNNILTNIASSHINMIPLQSLLDTATTCISLISQNQNSLGGNDNNLSKDVFLHFKEKLSQLPLLDDRIGVQLKQRKPKALTPKKRSLHDFDENIVQSERKKQKVNNSERVFSNALFFPVDINVNSLMHEFFLEKLQQEEEEKIEEEEILPSQDIIVQELPLSDKQITELDELVEKLSDSLFSVNDDKSDESIQQGIITLFSQSPQTALKYIEEKSLNEPSLRNLTEIIITKELTYHQTQLFSKILLVPKIKNLEKPASRILLSTLQTASDNYPKQIMENVVLELLRNTDIDNPLSKFQVEVIQRIITENINNSSPELIPQFFGIFLGDSFPHSWSEQTVQLLTTLINKRYTWSNEHFQQLLQRMKDNISSLGDSIKFASLLSNLLGKYQELILQNKILFKSILDKCTSRMASSLSNRFNKLK